MVVRLGFSNYAAVDIINGKGIDLIDEWLNLDDDNVKTVLQNVQKSGDGGQGEMISFRS